MGPHKLHCPPPVGCVARYLFCVFAFSERGWRMAYVKACGREALQCFEGKHGERQRLRTREGAPSRGSVSHYPRGDGRALRFKQRTGLTLLQFCRLSHKELSSWLGGSSPHHGHQQGNTYSNLETCLLPHHSRKIRRGIASTY